MALVHIYLFRHGQTYYNRAKVFTGWKDSLLTPQGFKDAAIVGRKLKNKKFCIAIRSDLTRSTQTLKQVLKYHKGQKIRVIVDPRIRERHYGKLCGLKHKTIIAKYGQKQFDIWHRSYDVPPPGGESVKMVEKRVNAFLKDLFKLAKKEKCNIAISAHGNSMRPMRRYFEHLSIQQMMKLENPWDDYFDYTIKV